MAGGQPAPALEIKPREVNMMKKLVVLVLLSMCLVACSSTFVTSRFDKTKWAPTGQAVEGIVYYEPRQVIVTYEFTALTDKEGKLIGTAIEGKCKKILQKQEIMIEPNFDEPMVLLNRPSPFSTSKLSVSLSNGMITNINSESTPQIQELIKAVASVAAVVAPFMAPAPGTPTEKVACNAAPVIASKEQYPYK